MLAPDQRHRQCFEAISLPAGGIGAGADEGQINLAGLQQFIYFAISFTLDELDFVPQLVGNKIQQLMIVDHGFPGRNHGRHSHPDNRAVPGSFIGLITNHLFG